MLIKRGPGKSKMRARIYKILGLFVVILVNVSSSYDSRYYKEIYDDWMLPVAKEYRDETDSEYDESEHGSVPKDRIDIKMPDVSPPKVNTVNL